MKIPIMIVEDESIVAMELSSYLEYLDYEVVAIANNFKDALDKALRFRPHIIMMDIRIKGDIDGIDTASKIKEKINTSIIYLTAFSDETTIIRAIKTEPSSYLVKPFNKNELSASLKMADLSYEKNRVYKKQRVGDIKFDDEFSFNVKANQLIFRGENIHLTKRELQLLYLLVKANNSIVSIYEMENEIWPDKLPNENTRRTLVSRLRAKLNYKFLETISGVGYRINI